MTTAIALLQAATPGSEPHVIPFFVFTLLKLIAVFTVYMVGVALLTLAPSPLIPCADVRLELQSVFSLGDLEETPADLLREVKLEVRRQRQAEPREEAPLRRSA